MFAWKICDDAGILYKLENSDISLNYHLRSNNRLYEDINTRNKFSKDKCVVWMDGVPVEGALILASFVPMKFIMQCLKLH